jgi:salicylate hydroxylase
MAEFPAQETPLRIAICGGGIGGLAIAIGLLKQNFDVTVYEQSSSFREIGAGIGFGKNSMTAMRLIDPELYAGFMRIATNNGSEAGFDTWFDFIAGMNVGGVSAGTYLGTIKVDSGNAQCMAARADLLDEMVKLIPHGTAQFNKKVLNIIQDDPEKVVIEFADGSKSEADAVVGCDGVKAMSRGIVLDGDPNATAPVFTSKYAYRGLVSMSRAMEVLGKEAATNRRMYLGHHGHLICFPVAQGKMMNVVAFKDKPDGVWDGSTWVEWTTKDEMIRDFSGFSDTVLKILAVWLNKTVEVLILT